MTRAETAARFGTRTQVLGYVVSVRRSLAAELDLWSKMAGGGAALPFQSHDWLATWSATIGRREDYEQLAVTVHDCVGAPVLGLPLVRERKRLCRIGFADGGVADYSGPILGRAAPQDAARAKELWHALLAALPATDLVQLERMPLHIGRMKNPFTLLRGRTAATDCDLELRIPGSFADWRQAFPRRYRMELGRCARLFEALSGARFERIRGDGAACMDALEVLQRERIDALERSYHLDEPLTRSFYRRLAANLSAGPAVLTALLAEGRVIAALLGLRDGDRYVMLRIGADAAYSRLSPARHLIVQTIACLRAEGVETFDFGLGDYPYKRKLGGETIALHDLIAARSPLGVAALAAQRVKLRLRTYPRAHAAAKRLRGLLRR